jgi:hypothetical protein
MRCAALLWDPEQVEHRTSPEGQRSTGCIDIHWLARMRRIAPPRAGRLAWERYYAIEEIRCAGASSNKPGLALSIAEHPSSAS